MFAIISFHTAVVNISILPPFATLMYPIKPQLFLYFQELAASNADYAMPEYYFKVSRQERNEGGGGAGGGGGGGKRGGGRNAGGGGAGKFFSTITRFAWDDLGM